MSDGPPASGSMAEASASGSTPSLVGQVLDRRYRLTKKLGEGGMGEVYAAEHVHIDKKVAIKLLRPEIVSNKEAVTRFYQEARSSSSIGHRNIIAIDDFGELSDGRIYMCMELLNGAALNDLIQQPLGADRLLNILIQTGHGLAAAHAKGITHRDMKPENIFVTIGPNGEDVPKILDFGIAKVSGNDGQNHLTRTGTIFGTPFYMAPEQALGNPVDARTDIYAVGVIMYECFAGSLPFQGESFMGILTQHITTDAEPVAQRAGKAGRGLPLGVAEIIARCMAKNPQHRFQTMDELVNALIGVYRGIAGPGMSTYMEAFPVGSSQHIVQATPSPMQRPTAPGTKSPTMPAGPPPSGGYGVSHQSQPMIPGQSGPVGAHLPSPSGMYSPASSSSVQVPKKSSMGIVIAILAVLAVGGAITAFVLLSNKDDKGGSQAGSATGSQAVAGSDHGTTPGSDHTVEIGSAKGSDTTTHTDPGSNAEIAKGSDTGTHVAAGSSVEPAGSDTHVAAAAIPISLSGKNTEFDIWEDGKKIDSTPATLMFTAGTTRQLVLKAKGYKDKPLTIDGSKTKYQVKLDKIPGAVVVHPPPPPGHPDCSQKILNPRDKTCVQQYCDRHPDDMNCQTE